MSDLIAPEVTDPRVPAPRSVVEQIKAKKAARDPKLELPIPAWGGSLYVAYRRLSPKQVSQASSSGKPQVVNARILALACIEVFAIDPETGDRTPVRELLGDSAPVRFDGRLADAFDVKGERPDQIVRNFYEDDLALAAHAQRLLKWQTGEDLDRVSEEELEELAGED